MQLEHYLENFGSKINLIEFQNFGHITLSIFYGSYVH